jgi:hypothetical protein
MAMESLKRDTENFLVSKIGEEIAVSFPENEAVSNAKTIKALRRYKQKMEGSNA